MMDIIKNVQSDNASTMKSVTNVVSPADPLATNEPQQVTQWVDDTALQQASLPQPVVPSGDLIDSGTEIRDHNIYDILSRPVKLGDVKWTDAQTADSTPIATFNFPEDLITASANISDKISHFTFLRAHVVIRFVVNANTFQAGRLVAYFAPFSNASEIGDRTLVNEYMGARTVFPRVVLDAGSGNSGELTIPYVSYFSHYNLAQGFGDMGTVRIVVLNPLKVGDAYVSIFARFTNISLEIPTAVPNQLGMFSSLYSKFKSLMHLGVSRDNIERALLDVPRAQVGEAVAKAEQGLISGTLQKVSEFSSALSNITPFGKYLTPISWIAQASSQVANYFGLSKPANLTSQQRFVNLPGFGFTNVDGADSSLILGASCENEIGTRPDVFGSHLDEMDIAFICQHESYLDSFTWSVSQNPGTNLFSFQVCPGTCKYRPIGSAAVFDSTALSYVSSMFRYWRGSIKIKVQVTKTAYHSGRLRISFVPGGVLPNTGYDFNQGYSEIVDLRTSDEVEFVIPFVSNTMFKSAVITPRDIEGTIAGSTGIVTIDVLNALRRPDSVTDTLDCNVWISGGDDIQFAVPDLTQYMPAIADDMDIAFGIEPFTEGVPRAQVLGQFQDVGFNSMTDMKNQMFTSKPVPAIDASASCIGEHVQNLRQIIKRFGIIYSDSLAANTTAMIGFHTGYFGTIAKTSAINTGIGICPLDYVSWLYRFRRGGIRYKMLVDQVTTVGTMLSLNDPVVTSVPVAPAKYPAASSFWLYLLSSGSCFLHQASMVLNNMLEVQAPYYSNTFISLVRSATGGTTATDHDDRASIVYMGADFPATQGANIGATFFKAAADDFSFGWLVGPPRLIRRPIDGVTRVLNFSGGTTLVSDNDGQFTFANVVLTPALSDPDNERILYASASSFNVALVGGGTMSVPFVGSFVSRAGATVAFKFNIADPSTIDIPATIVLLAAVPNVTIITINA